MKRIVAIGMLFTITSGVLAFPLSAYMAPPPSHPVGDASRDTTGRDITGRDTTDRDTITNTGKSVANYLSGLYLWFLGFVGIAAFLAIVIGGVMWMFSTSLTSTASARRWITNAIWGIALAAASFLLLNTINPDLVNHGFDIEYLLKSK